MKKKKKKEIYGVGRRKTAVARVFVRKGISENLINRRISISDYFSNQPLLLKEIFFPLKLLEKENKYSLIIRVNGEVFSSQAKANNLTINITKKINKKKILRNYYKRQVKNMIINFLQKKKESIKKNKKNNYDSIIIPRSFFFKNSFLLNQLSLFKLLLFHLSH